MTDSGPSSSAKRRAPTTFAPLETPAKIPSSRASRPVISIASSFSITETVVHARAIEVRRHQPGPALHRERPSLAAAGDRRRGGGLEPDDADLVIVRIERLRHAHERAGGADAVAEGGDAPRRLVPDFAPERVSESGDDVRVVELVRRIGTRFTRQIGCTLDHVLDVLRRDAPRPFDRRDDFELRTEGAHELQSLLAEAVGDDDPRGVALRSADEGERRPGAATGVLDDRRPRLEERVALRAFDHRERQPILHRARWIQILELHPELGAVWRRERLQANERCVPNRREDARLGHCSDPNDVTPPGPSQTFDGILRTMSWLRLTFRRWLIRGLSKIHLAVQRLSRRPGSQQARRNARALTHNDGPEVRQGAHDTSHVLPRRARSRGDRVERRRGSRSRLVLNLQQEPRAVVQIGTDRLSVEARTATPEERERLWVGITATYPGLCRLSAEDDAAGSLS